MTKEDVISSVIEVLQEIQVISGRPGGEITSTTRPMHDLAGFDSLNAVEASTFLSESLNCEIGPDLGLFVQGTHFRTVSEISSEIVKIMEESEKTRKKRQQP